MEIKVVLSADDKLISVLQMIGLALSSASQVSATNVEPTVLKGAVTESKQTTKKSRKALPLKQCTSSMKVLAKSL